MQLFFSALVLVAAVSSSYGQFQGLTLEQYRHACPAIWTPVCGSDNQTYANDCFLKARAQLGKPDLFLVHSGPCDSRDIKYPDNGCPAISKFGMCFFDEKYKPVCASNGVTYPTICSMCVNIYRHGEKLHVVHNGTCEKVKRDVQDNDEKCPEYSKHGICTLEYAPVCASNGKTYANKCGMCAEMYEQNTQLHVVHQGICEPDATLYEAEFCRPEWKRGVCTLEYNPICGTDGITYGNPCMFCYAMFQKQAKGNNMRVKREGECQDEDKLVCPEMYKNGICTLEYSPVCGTDGRMYPNKCMFCTEQANKLKEGVEIYFDHYGMCYI